LLHAENADNSEVKREFRYLSITLLGLDNGKEEQPICWQDNYFRHQKPEIF
jgi:hypothetical protein